MKQTLLKKTSIYIYIFLIHLHKIHKAENGPVIFWHGKIYYDFKISLPVIKLVRKRIHFLFKSKHVTVWTLGFERWCSLFTWEANANYKPSRPWKKRQLKKQPFKFLEKCWIKKITCLVVQDIKSFFPSVCLPNYIRKATSIIPISGEFQGCCFSSSCPCNLIVYHTWT